METDIKEEKIVVLRRVPPGDRWEFASTSGGPIFASLTSALDAWFQKTQNTNFYIELDDVTFRIFRRNRNNK